MEPQKTPNSQAILRKTNLEASCPPPISNCTSKPQSLKQYGTRTKKKTYRSMEQNRELRNEPPLHGQHVNKGDKNKQWGNDSLFNKWF